MRWSGVVTHQFEKGGQKMGRARRRPGLSSPAMEETGGDELDFRRAVETPFASLQTARTRDQCIGSVAVSNCS